jgi:putative sigma-54 modulation protein
MQLNLTGKNFQVTPAIKSHAQDKFESLEMRYAQINNIHIVLHIDHIDHIAEATLHFHTNEIHATATAKDMYLAIDSLIEKLSSQIHKQKEKIIDSHRHST